ncbi:hypothetical protein G6F17_009019 [Rhizopus arrhizus]|nr:hypothetical protein G6F18_002983 [Rhizopus arrhizus]KAG0851418.1 hypothetical protein G6F17_009019 [Rhizopus arrhizus]KAG0891275.1 hypothetical protein G6F34_011814 [Rhizopus arrhizus]KAG0930004.1 hypothetical protein G6F30_011803 [Rhizopus arrhizus]
MIRKGLGNFVGENGEEAVITEMEVDDETYPLDSVTNYDQSIGLKPPEKQVIKKEKVERAGELLVEAHSTGKGRYAYRKYSDEDKEYFFELVYEKGLKVAQAARKLGMPTRTAQVWYDRDQKDPQDIIQRKTAKNPVGRPPSLGEEHRVFLVDYIDKKPSLTLDEIMDGLSAQFMDLSISKTATDMDYLSSCIFINEAAFHINMKRTVAWSKIGSRAEVVMPKTRAKTTTILGAISPYGVINVKVRKPRAVNQNKKRKSGGGKAVINTQSRDSTVTGHYFNFICDIMDVLDKHEEFKDCYIVMDNAPIHKNADIEKEINRRGYGCVYLPPYSPELNPIEQFWSVCKSKMKREELLQEETLSSRIHIP